MHVGEDTNPISVPPSSLSQPIPIDTSGNMKIDLLGTLPNAGSVQVWQNVWNASNPDSPLFNVWVEALSPPMYADSSPRVDAKLDGPQCKLSHPHSNAVVDHDGDCLAGKPFSIRNQPHSFISSRRHISCVR